MGDRDTSKKDALNMPFKSCYFELASESDELLMESGYRKFPAYVPRWDVLSGDVYGRCPGMDTLGDIKQLQHQQKRKAQAIDKMVNPPMVAPTSLKGKPSTVLPGQTTYVDPMQGGQGFVPAYQVQPRISELQVDIAEVQNRIQRGFYADLFAMMINSDRRQMTATEVVERHEEKLVLLGPVLQRINVELLDPLLDDVFEYALEAGLLPEPPEALAGEELEVEYISLLAQAQSSPCSRILWTGSIVTRPCASTLRSSAQARMSSSPTRSCRLSGRRVLKSSSRCRPCSRPASSHRALRFCLKPTRRTPMPLLIFWAPEPQWYDVRRKQS
jgi:hypothetical protein